MIARLPSSSISRVGAILFLCLLGADLGADETPAREGGADSGSGEERLGELPDEFFQWQDDLGFFWRAEGNGALTSGEARYLQSGLNLLVDGAPFAPTTGARRAPDESSGPVGLTLRETRQTLAIERDLRFDRERAAVRVFDSVTNAGEEARTVEVKLRTTYPFGWQGLHGADGELVPNDPTLRLDEDETGLLVHFSPAEGRHDTLVLLGGRGGRQPGLSGSSNRRELTLTYELEIPAGETRALLHWILQRNLSEPAATGDAFSSLIQRGRLIRPLVEPAALKKVANFSAESLPSGAEAPAQLRSLIALNRVIDAIGMHRRDEDLHWVSSVNQIAGKVSASGPLTVSSSRSGERSVALADVAALRGGAGIGRPPLVYLRDGRVLAGRVEAPGLEIATGPDGETDALDPETLNLLLLHVEPGDGAPPDGTRHFLELADGGVHALAANAETRLRFAAAGGSREVPLAGLVEVGYFSRPTPGFRVVEEDGSRYGAFLHGGTLALDLAGGGSVEIAAHSVRRLWPAGASALTVGPVEGVWLDFSEVPEDSRPEAGVLLAGNDVLAGTLEDARLTLTEAGADIRVPTTRIASIRRSLEAAPDGGPSFEVELHDGERLEGTIASPYLSVARGSGAITVPVARLFAYRAPAP